MLSGEGRRPLLRFIDSLPFLAWAWGLTLLLVAGLALAASAPPRRHTAVDFRAGSAPFPSSLSVTPRTVRDVDFEATVRFVPTSSPQVVFQTSDSARGLTVAYEPPDRLVALVDGNVRVLSNVVHSGTETRLVFRYNRYDRIECVLDGRATQLVSPPHAQPEATRLSVGRDADGSRPFAGTIRIDRFEMGTDGFGRKYHRFRTLFQTLAWSACGLHLLVYAAMLRILTTKATPLPRP